MTATLGELLYGLKPWTITASSVDPDAFGLITGFDHQGCELSAFCRNPLHPGPCKGWKKKLGMVAPGALTAIEKAHKEKVAARRVARAAAKSEAEKRVAAGPGHILTHPLIAKKATLEHVHTIMGDDPSKAKSKAGKAILNKAEIRRFSKLKGAQIADLAVERGWTTDKKKYASFAEERIAEALRADNADGGNKHLQDAVNAIGGALAGQFADKHCGVGSKDGDCDGIAWEGLRERAEYVISSTLATGNPDMLNKLESDLAKLGSDHEGLKKYLGNHGVDLKKVAEAVGEAEPEPDLTPFEKGEKTKMDKLADTATAQKKAAAGGEALAKLGLMSTGKKLTDAQKAQLAGSVRKHQAGESVSGGPDAINAMVDKGVETIAAKTKKMLGLDIGNDGKAQLADEIKAAVNGEGDGKTPLLDQLQQEWAKTMHGLYGPGGAPEEKKTEPADPVADLKKLLAGDVVAASDAVAAVNDIDQEQWDKLTSSEKGKLGDIIAGSADAGVPGAEQANAKLHGFGTAPPAKSTEGVTVTQLKQMFGPDGNPFHDEAVAAVNGMNQHQWEQLSPAEKMNAADHVNDAVSAEVPGADAAAGKLKKLGAVAAAKKAKASEPAAPGNVTQVGPGAKVLNSTQAEAAALSIGAKSGTAKMKLAVYQKLADEGGFEDLSPTSQKLIVQQLDGMEKKFLDPKKKAQVQAIKSKFEVAAGGGAGAGGNVGDAATPEIPKVAKTNAEKVEAASDLLVELSYVQDGPDAETLKAGIKKHTTELFGKFFENGTEDTGAAAMAAVQAKPLVVQLDDHGVPFQGPTADDLATALAADIKAKLLDSGASTPVLDAYKTAKKIKDLKAQGNPGAADLYGFAVDDFLNAAANWHVAHGTGKAAAAGTKQGALQSLHDWTGAPGKPYAGYDLDTEAGVFEASNELSANHFGSATDKLHLPQSMIDGWVDGGFSDQVLEELAANYRESLEFNLPIPGGLAGELTEIADKVAAKGQEVQVKNGWPEDSEVLAEFKRDLFEVLVQQKIDGTSSGAGAGGTASTPSAGPVNVPDVAETPEGEEPVLAQGDGVAHFSEGVKTAMGASLKKLPVGGSSSDSVESIFDGLVGVAAHYGDAAPGGSMSVLQAAQAVDEWKAKQYGGENKHLTEKKLISWLGTKNGKEYAEHYSTPKATVLDWIENPNKAKPQEKVVYVAPGLKVQDVGGPGPYDPNLKTSDFAAYTAEQAEASQSKYMAAAGEPWTPSESAALTAYTGSSYAEINDYMRGVTGDVSAWTKEQAKRIQAAMRPLQENQLLIRGSSYKVFPEGFRNIEGVQQLIGKEITDDGFVSTSVAGSGGEFTKAIKLHIEAPVGTMGAFVKSISSHPHENETILAAGTKYRIVGVENPYSDQPIVRLRVIS